MAKSPLLQCPGTRTAHTARPMHWASRRARQQQVRLNETDLWRRLQLSDVSPIASRHVLVSSLCFASTAQGERAPPVGARTATRLSSRTGGVAIRHLGPAVLSSSAARPSRQHHTRQSNITRSTPCRCSLQSPHPTSFSCFNCLACSSFPVRREFESAIAKYRPPSIVGLPPKLPRRLRQVQQAAKSTAPFSAFSLLKPSPPSRTILLWALLR